ncbi:MAG: hypothetical protein AB7L91_00395 [Dehalococcoidia bacterium]
MTAEIRDWDEVCMRLERRWPGLERGEIEASHGNREALLALLQGRLGYARTNAEEDLDEVLRGESVIPDDIADEQTHTGTSEPVGPVSDATDFTGGSRQEVEEMTSNQSASDREPGELPTQPPEVTSIPGGGTPFGSAGMGTTGSGAGGGDAGRWQSSGQGQDPFDPMREMHGHNGDGMPMAIPKAAAGAAAVGVTALAVGLIVRRKRKKSKTEDVAEQARRLISDISERMPTVEEVRAKVLAIDEMRSRKELKGKKLMGLGRK